VKRSGKDITLVAYSRMVHVALEAAEALAARGVEVEVIDLRTLRPLDLATVVDSVKKTNRAVVVEETWKTGGFAGELAASIQEEAFDYLDGPVGRVGGVEVPAPYNGRLEDAALPDSDRVIQAVERLYGI
jgi:pyruvate dehydrogenase E1 component beta subunit